MKYVGILFPITYKSNENAIKELQGLGSSVSDLNQFIIELTGKHPDLRKFYIYCFERKIKCFTEKTLDSLKECITKANLDDDFSRFIESSNNSNFGFVTFEQFACALVGGTARFIASDLQSPEGAECIKALNDFVSKNQKTLVDILLYSNFIRSRIDENTLFDYKETDLLPPKTDDIPKFFIKKDWWNEYIGKRAGLIHKLFSEFGEIRSLDIFNTQLTIVIKTILGNAFQNDSIPEQLLREFPSKINLCTTIEAKNLRDIPRGGETRTYFNQQTSLWRAVPKCTIPFIELFEENFYTCSARSLLNENVGVSTEGFPSERYDIHSSLSRTWTKAVLSQHQADLNSQTHHKPLEPQVVVPAPAPAPAPDPDPDTVAAPAVATTTATAATAAPAATIAAPAPVPAPAVATTTATHAPAAVTATAAATPTHSPAATTAAATPTPTPAPAPAPDSVTAPDAHPGSPILENQNTFAADTQKLKTKIKAVVDQYKKERLGYTVSHFLCWPDEDRKNQITKLENVIDDTNSTLDSIKQVVDSVIDEIKNKDGTVPGKKQYFFKSLLRDLLENATSDMPKENLNKRPP